MGAPLKAFGVLALLSDEDEFVRRISDHCWQEAQKCFLKLDISKDRLLFAYREWQRDVTRTSEKEYGGAQLDQYKLAGFLCFWFRRASPIIGITESPELGIRSAGNDIIESVTKEQDFFYKHANEFLAFDIGYKICQNVNVYRKISPNESRKFVVPSPKFFNDVYNVLKTKSVSPHGLYLIYAALFEGS